MRIFVSVSDKKKELFSAIETKRKSIEKRWGPLEYLRFPPWIRGYNCRLDFLN